jgi:AbrB family looped-hinge helix DNA binding protein
MMKFMERRIVTVDAHGQFVLPPEVQAALGLRDGSQLEVSVAQRQIVLRPVIEDRIAAARGMFGPGPSLEDDLIEWRASDGW